MAARLTGVALLALALVWTGTAVAGQSDKDDLPQLARSTDCAKAYQHYQRSFYPHYFAISEDGRACGYTYCTSGCAKSSSPVQALKECEGVSGGRSCSVYAFRGAVVSEGGVKPGGGQ